MGILSKIFSAIQKKTLIPVQMIDSRIVRAHQTSSGKISNRADRSIGRSSGGLSTKIHVRVDGKGRPL